MNIRINQYRADIVESVLKKRVVSSAYSTAFRPINEIILISERSAYKPIYAENLFDNLAVFT